jgi:hypothetical protein
MAGILVLLLWVDAKLAIETIHAVTVTAAMTEPMEEVVCIRGVLVEVSTSLLVEIDHRCLGCPDRSRPVQSTVCVCVRSSRAGCYPSSHRMLAMSQRCWLSRYHARSCNQFPPSISFLGVPSAMATMDAAKLAGDQKRVPRVMTGQVQRVPGKA